MLSIVVHSKYYIMNNIKTELNRIKQSSIASQPVKTGNNVWHYILRSDQNSNVVTSFQVMY